LKPDRFSAVEPSPAAQRLFSTAPLFLIEKHLSPEQELKAGVGGEMAGGEAGRQPRSVGQEGLRGAPDGPSAVQIFQAAFLRLRQKAELHQKVSDAVLPQLCDLHNGFGLFLVKAEKRVMQIQFGFLQEVDVLDDIGILTVENDMMA